MTTKESEVDVLAVMEDAARRIYVNAETQEDNDASDALLKAHAAVAEVFEAASDGHETPTAHVKPQVGLYFDPAKAERLRTALRNAGVKV